MSLSFSIISLLLSLSTIVMYTAEGLPISTLGPALDIEIEKYWSPSTSLSLMIGIAMQLLDEVWPGVNTTSKGSGMETSLDTATHSDWIKREERERK